ncbi:Odorant receptor 33a-like protein [Tribolium castaneum]|uniref:Odorant receptor 33a-like protein n=1 Tax=Tribolium castaneum TaxID=7070 RepID=A0A139WMK2_TRICA|nr:Odorant receptor 33a-like protein [Tribolium castaneum]
MYVFFIILVPTLTIYNYIIQENFDILQFNYTATFLAETVSWIAKLLPFITNANRMKKCITYFGTRYFEEMLQRYTSAKIMKECISVCRRNSTVFLYGVICGMTSFITKPLFWKGYQLPLDMWLPFDATSGPGIYYTTYSFLAIAISYCAFAGTLIDPLIGGLACHATGQLKVLKLSKIKTFGYYFIQLVFYFGVILAQIYFYCFYGSTLFEESSSIINAVYSSKWYDFDVPCRKALLILMERAQTPITVAAGKIMDLSLVTFATILRRSYSLVAVLNNYQ